MLASVSRDGLNFSVFSDDWIGAFDDVIRFFIEVEIIRSDSSVNTGFIEIVLDHSEEALPFIRMGGEVERGSVPVSEALGDLSDH